LASKRPLRTSRQRWEDNIENIIEKYGMKMQIGFIWSPVVGSCEHANELPVL
jgi:hypothetical protein